MVPHRPSQKLPLFICPTWWQRKIAQKAERSLLGRFSPDIGANAMQAGCGAQYAAHRVLVESGGGVSAAQCIEERNRDARDLRGAARMRIGSSRGGAEARHGREREAFALRQSVAPVIPKAGFSQGELAVGLDALAAFATNHFFPVVLHIRGVLRRDLLDRSGEDIQVVDFTQEVLKALQVVAPQSVLLREQTLHCVSQAFQPDA